MFSLVTSTVLALVVASASAHSISPLHRRHAQVARATPPKGWATTYLEPYDAYHTRYLAIGCDHKHNTSTFDLCCHPLLATETLAKNRNPCCVPGATVECPNESPSLVAVTSTKATSAPAASSTPAEDDEDCDAGDDEDDTGDAGDDGDADEDDEDCSDDSDDEPSSAVSTKAAVTSTKAAVTSTKAAVTSAPAAVAAVAASPSTTEKATPTSTQVKATLTSTEVKATTTSTEAQPTTTSTEDKPTTTPKPTTTKTTTTQQATTTSPSSGSGLFTGGFGTWFTQNGVAGACGKVHPDTAMIVALQTSKYDNGANCGRTVQITDVNNGKTTTATVADECPTCTNENCLDMSESLFQFFEDLSVGEMKISWKFTD